jgi:hypothetical protein
MRELHRRMKVRRGSDHGRFPFAGGLGSIWTLLRHGISGWLDYPLTYHFIHRRLTDFPPHQKNFRFRVTLVRHPKSSQIPVHKTVCGNFSATMHVNPSHPRQAVGRLTNR